MAKKKAKAAETGDIFADIAAETNADVLGDIESVKYFVDTGNLAFNYTCSGKFIGGGVPGGKIIEIYGPSSSGKSLVANNCLRGCQELDGYAILLDCENSANKEFMQRASHVDPARLIIPRGTTTLEKTFLKIHNMCQKIREREEKLKIDRKPIVFVFDSLSVPPCNREIEETNLPEDFTEADWKKIVGRKEQPGERARVISDELRKLNAKIEEYDATVVIINQVRMQIGVMYGSPETRPGGKSLEFYASCIVRTAQKKKIENKKLDTYAGVNMQVKNQKNKVFNPFVTAEDIKVYFKTGIDPTSGLLKCLIQDERINMYSAGRFEVLPDYLPEGMDEYKFQASKTNNTMPLEPILDCPKLVDAETREQVETYLANFASAMESTASDDFEEKEAKFDADGYPIDSDE